MTGEQLKTIQQFDTCTVLDAIESFGVRLRNEGYAKPGLQWLCPSVKSVIGYAVTLRMKSSNPPMRGTVFEQRTEWWRAVDLTPAPRIAVVQDVDEAEGVGSVAGEVHAAIMQRLGCAGLVTNGSVRDLSALEAMGFGCSARSVSPSHAYGHTVDHSQPVKIYGLTVNPGDLIMADRHGVISIPEELGPEIPRVAEEMIRRNQGIIDYCHSADFTLDGLRDKVE